MSKQYSEIAVAIDLVSDAYNTNNPIIISEKIKEDLNMDITIHQIQDYLELQEDYEKESKLIEYYQIHY